MAPLRERFAQESVFESGKPCKASAFSKAIISTTNNYVKKVLKTPQHRQLLVHLVRESQQRNLICVADMIERGNVSLVLEEAEKHLKLALTCESTPVLALVQLYLGFLWRIRQKPRKVAFHLLEMFKVDPAFTRKKLVPVLWEELFLPRFSVLERWYHKGLLKIKSAVTSNFYPRGSYSFEALYTDSKGKWKHVKKLPQGRACIESEEKLKILNNLYWDALDENTRIFAEFYQDGIYEFSVLHNKGRMYGISGDRNKVVEFPLVNVPHLRVQIVQREVLSRRKLTEEIFSHKENISPGDLAQKSKFSPGVLKGMDLNESELLRAWTDTSSSTKNSTERTGRNALSYSSHLSPLLSSTTSLCKRLLKTKLRKRTQEQEYDASSSATSLTQNAMDSDTWSMTSSSRASPLSSMSSRQAEEHTALGNNLHVSSPLQVSKEDVARADNTLDSHINLSTKSSQLHTRDCHVNVRSSKETSVEHLRQVMTTLWSAKKLEECEQIIPTFAKIWMESHSSKQVESFLTKPVVIDITMDLLTSSSSTHTQRAAVCLLTDFVHSNENVRQRVVSYDPNLQWLKNMCSSSKIITEIPQIIVLVYLLKLQIAQIEELNVVPGIMNILERHVDVSGSSDVENYGIRLLRAPKAAAVFLLEQLVSYGGSLILSGILSYVPCLVKCFLQAETPEEQVSMMAVLLACIEKDATCAEFIARYCMSKSKKMKLVRFADEQARVVVFDFLKKLSSLNIALR